MRGLLPCLAELTVVVRIYAYNCLDPASILSTLACLFTYNSVNYCRYGILTLDLVQKSCLTFDFNDFCLLTFDFTLDHGRGW